MTLLQVQDAIVTQLRNNLAQDIYDNGVPEDAKLRFDANKNLLPYVVVEHAGINSIDLSMPITGVKDASGESACSVLCIAPTQRASRQIAELVRANLIGFQAAGSGELKPITSPFTYVNAEAKPIRYISELVFTFSLNTVW